MERDSMEALDKIIPHLTERETSEIMQVIQRDELLRQRDHYRIMKLKSELQNLRRKGALKCQSNSDHEGKSCARCRTELGTIINRGALCRACRLRVCKRCREFGNRTTDWVCCVCQKNMEIQAATGEWMNEFVNRSESRREENVHTPATDVLKRSIRQPWTISNVPPPRWKRNATDERASSSYRDSRVTYKSEDTMEESSNIADGMPTSKSTKLMKIKSKSMTTSQDSSEETRDKENEIVRTNSDKKVRYKPQKTKVKIRRQASLEDQFPAGSENKEEKGGEKRIQFAEELKIPKIEVVRKNSLDDGPKSASFTEYTISSPNSSKLRERFSKSKMMRNESLNVELSKSSDSGLGISRSTEDESGVKENTFFKFFEGDTGRLYKSDTEKSPNFLDTVSLFSRPRSRERSVSSDSSDRNLSDLDKPSIKIRKRHEYSESRDSSSSFEGNFYDTHISNRVRKLHEVALKQMSEENSRVKKSESGSDSSKKRSVEFRHPAEFGSCESVAKKSQSAEVGAKLRKFKSLERTDSKSPVGRKSAVEFAEAVDELQVKSKARLKKQERIEKRFSFKDAKYGLRLSADRKKEKRFAKESEEEEEESDEIVESTEKAETKLVAPTRLSRKDKKGPKKPKRALSEEKQSFSTDKRLSLRSIAAGKYRSDSETRQGEDCSESETDFAHRKEMLRGCSRLETKMEKEEAPKRAEPPLPEKSPAVRLETRKCEPERSKPVEYVEIGPYLEVIGKILPISDDYKLVFISSDSSTKENRSVSSDSESSGPSSESGTDTSRKLDFDWDYFESSSVVKSVVKDWNWSGRNFRSSPVFSTSDDNSPKFPRRTRLIEEKPEVPMEEKKEEEGEEEEEEEDLEQDKTEEEGKKSKKRRKSRKQKRESSDGKPAEVEEEGPHKPTGSVEEREEAAVNAMQSVPPDGVRAEESVDEPVLEVIESKSTLTRNKTKKKNKKKCDKRGNKSEVPRCEVAPEEPGDQKTDYNLETGTFGGFPGQNIIPRQDIFSVNRSIPIQNLVPVPVLIPVPVPFPVPTAFWSQCQNFMFPNFAFGDDLINNLQSIYTGNYLGQRISRTEDNKDDEEAGRLIGMQRPALAISPAQEQQQQPSDKITDSVGEKRAKRRKSMDEAEIDAILKDVFVEGKTFREVKNALKGELEDYSTSSGSSDESDYENGRKHFKKSYYFNPEERKTSDDSDIADVSGPDEECEYENTSQGETTASEDEGNPDPSFSEVLILNCSESDSSPESKKHREGLPGIEKSPEEEDTTGSEDDDPGIILLKHIKKLPEDDREILMGELSATESMEMSTAEEHRDLHTRRTEGEKIRSEEPVSLVPYLSAASRSGAVDRRSEIVPECLTVAVLDNTTKSVHDDISTDRENPIEEEDTLPSAEIGSENQGSEEGEVIAEFGDVNGDCNDVIKSRKDEKSCEYGRDSRTEDAGSQSTKYTSLVMITQENDREIPDFVKVITNDTTRILKNGSEQFHDDICLKHTNGNYEEEKGLEEYFTMTLENSPGATTVSPKKPNVIMTTVKEEEESEEVRVVTDDKTLSAVICLEEGLADDDSWVEDLDKDRENDFDEDTSSGDDTHIAACTPVHMDREEELRGYHRGAINFTLHTIVEESCEESEMEDKGKKQRPASATDLEKYFYFDIGGGVNPNFETQDVDTFSESSSSIYSDGGTIDDGVNEKAREKNSEQSQLSTSRLEKYFLNFDRDGREKESDGSVGSDSEGPPSPEQRRKRLFRARASSRLHSNSMDNLVQSENEQQSMDMVLDSEDSSTETDEPEVQNDKSDDVKRKKKRKISGGNVPLVVIQEGGDKAESEGKENEPEDGNENESEEEGSKTPQPEFTLSDLMLTRDKQQSRDSGFIGSCDDLEKTGESNEKDSQPEPKPAENLQSSQQPSLLTSGPPAAALTRKDSFNNWSSDEETNLMMSKMRQFFKAMVSVPKTGNKAENMSPQPNRAKGAKPPQLVYFENELTRLMKTVPGIRDDQVREIVEYLSSEDTWSDSYDSSDYTSSDLEGTAAYYQRSQLQQEISESCKQIIDKFDQSKPDPDQRPKVPPRRNSSPMNRETAFVYQKLVASFNKITNENESPTPHSSPPFFAKVMHHIGSRLVALMHEVSSNSSGEGSISSHKARYHKRISQKLSNVSSTTEEEFGFTDESDYKAEEATTLPNPPYFTLLHQLPRSKSHDLLLEEAKGKSLRSSSSGVSDIVEEKEASDYERFSWRGSFESALMADSRSKLTLLSSDAHSSNATLAAKRRSAGDLLFLKSLSREQLDRVRSCGSIGGVALEDKNIWTTSRDRNGRRSSVPDAASPGSGASADGEEDSSDSEIIQERSITLPRSLQSISSSPNTNSLPRLPTTGAATTQSAPLSKAHSVQHFLPNVKSARYRPPGFSRMVANSPKRALSAPGLQIPQPSHARRERRRNQNLQNSNLSSLSVDELIPDAFASPQIHGGSKSASPSPIVGSAKTRLRRGSSSVGSPDWSTTDEIERLVALDQQRQNSSSLGARSDSMASVYSGAGEGRSCSIPVRGEVEFGLQYNYKAGDLEIHVKQCRDLAAVDAKRNRSDPYVKVYLLPDKSKSGKRKTKVKKHTLNPIFDEVLKFHISLTDLETRTLWLTVWHSDMFGRNDFLGEVMMSLENKLFDNPAPQSYLLQERTEPFEDILSYKGEVIIGLKFIPPDATTLQKKGKRSKGTLNVRVKEAKNLTAVKSNGISDPFCKSYLLPDKGRNSKQKTPVQRRTCNPFWNHTFVYEDVSLQELSERCLELTVWDHDRLASNEFLGGLRFSLGSGKHYGKSVDWMDSTGKEISLWQSMLEKPNLWVEGCLPLRASLDPPNSVS